MEGFAFCTASFGDRPTAVLFKVAIKKTAAMFWMIDPEAPFKILIYRYVDDLASGWGGGGYFCTRFLDLLVKKCQTSSVMVQYLLFCPMVPSN